MCGTTPGNPSFSIRTSIRAFSYRIVTVADVGAFACRPCLADEIAAAAELVKPKAGGMPVTVLRGLDRAVGPLDLPGARSIVRPAERDLFRWGADEAFALGLAEGRRERGTPRKTVTGRTGSEAMR